MNASSLKGAVHHRHHILPSSSSSPPSFPISSSSSSSRVLSAAAAATSLCPRQVVTVDLGLHSSSSEDSKRMAVMMNTSAKSVVVAAADAQAKRLCSQLAISHNSNTTTQQYSAQWLLNNAAATTTTTNTTISNQTNQANNKTTSCMSCRSCQAVEDNLVVLPAIKQSMAAQYGGYYTPGAGLGQRLRLLLLLLAIFAACLSVQVAPVVVHSASVISGASGGGGGAGGYGHGGIHGHAGHLLQTSGGSGANHGGGGQIIINAGGGAGGGGGGEGRHGSLIAPQQVVDIEEEAAAALIKQYHKHLEDDSPPCADEHSICGYVQVNSVGFNRVSLCSCGGSAEDGGSGGGGGRCPLWWERSTSRTVRHGNDFYKYCNRKPRLVPCMAGQVAYSSLNVYDKLTFDQVSVVHRAHCLCPADHILAANSSRPMFEQELENTILMGTEMLCTKMPRCSRRQFCLSISDGADATLEKRHCRCPLGQTCPKDPRQAAETQQMPRGAAYHMRCQ